MDSILNVFRKVGAKAGAEAINAYKETGAGAISNRDAKRFALAVEAKVEDFLVANQLCVKDANSLKPNFHTGLEAFDRVNSIGQTPFHDLVKQCVPEKYVQAAVEAISLVVNEQSKVTVSTPRGIMERPISGPDGAIAGYSNVTKIAVEQLVPAHMIGTMLNAGGFDAKAGIEWFGAQMDSTVVSDMKTAIVVQLMKFAFGLTERLMATRTTSDPGVIYEIRTVQIYNALNASAQSGINAIELLKNPNPVDVTLKDCIPLTANDSAGAYLLANGVIKNGVSDVDLIRLSLNNQPGQNAANYTDVLSDGVKVKNIRIKVTKPGDTPVVERFTIQYPAQVAALTWMVNNRDSADRMLSVDLPRLIAKTVKQTSGAASVILASLADTERVALQFIGQVRTSLKTSKTTGMLSVSYALRSIDPTLEIDEDTVTAFTGVTIEVEGYELEAKRSEGNFRPSSIAIRDKVHTLYFNIPAGTNYLYDASVFQGTSATDIASTLSMVSRIGIDGRTYSYLSAKANEIYNQVADFEATSDTIYDPSYSYAAGNLIHPTVILTELDISSLKTIRVADRSGDICEAGRRFLSELEAEIEIRSCIGKQLPEGKRPVYRVLTDPKTMALAFGVKHIHNHLQSGELNINGDVEFRVVLDNGAIMEFVTTLFSDAKEKLLIVPFMTDDPESSLNVGHNWVVGSVAGQLSINENNANYNRTFLNVREWPWVTCPVFAMVEVTGVKEANTVFSA